MKLGELMTAVTVINNHKTDKRPFKKSLKTSVFLDRVKIYTAQWEDELKKIWTELAAKDENDEYIQDDKGNMVLAKESIPEFNSRIEEIADTDVDVDPYFEAEDFDDLSVSEEETRALIPVIKMD